MMLFISLQDYQNTMDGALDALRQMKLIKLGREPSDNFNTDSGICDNISNYVYRNDGEHESTVAESIVSSAIEEIVFEYDIFNPCPTFPIKDPSGVLNADQYYLSTVGKYSLDVIDDRIKLAELIVEYCQRELNEE